MFVRSFISLAALAAAVAAAPSALQARDQCSTGPISCCNSVSKASDANASAALGLLGIVIESVDELVGFQCSPIVGSSSCKQQPVCCDNNHFGGLVSAGCSPVNAI